MAIDPETGAGSAVLISLEDDAVKLIAYTIVSLKRNKERIMDGGKDSVIVTDNMTGEAFTSWIMAKYLQQLVPDPKDNKKKVPRSKLIDPDELKYLRVYYVVSHRWPREPLKFEEREINVLQGIRNHLNMD
jgi:hypothetical protein